MVQIKVLIQEGIAKGLSYTIGVQKKLWISKFVIKELQCGFQFK
jgi:hypothetical protein